MRKITLCADDYAISPAVSASIRTLLADKRLNATSVMVGSPEIAEEAKALLAVQGDYQIGLHVTLTSCFEKSSRIEWLAIKSYLGLNNKQRLKQEIASQYDAFLKHFGRAPDFVDGHQHCHVLPQIRDVLLEFLRENNFQGWIRQTRGVNGKSAGQGTKAKIIARCSKDFADEAKDFTLNKSFSGAYDYHQKKDYAALFPAFLNADLIMCHPGRVCETLKKRDNLHDDREVELAYFQGEAFLNALKAAHVVL